MLERVAAAALAGWCLGWLSAWASAWLEASDDATAPRWRPKLVEDPLVQAASAACWGGLALQRDWWTAVEAGVIAVPLIQVAVTDLRTRYVYTAVALVGLLLGVAFGWQVHVAEWWTSIAGAVGGFVSFGALYLAGRLIYRGGEPLARGDVTIAAMVGAGASVCALQALTLGILLSGLFATGVWIARRSRHVYLPYGPGLCLGGVVTLFVC